jgi:uncharacterized protein YxeA
MNFLLEIISIIFIIFVIFGSLYVFYKTVRDINNEIFKN